MSKARRRLKAAKRVAEFRKRNHGPKRRCMNCGEETTHGHYAPPGLGSPGMWTCTSRPVGD